jgi:hypothetical protein
VKKGVKPKTIDAADHCAAFGLLARYGVAEATSILVRAFEDAFVVDKNATIRFIASKADTFRGRTVSKANGQHMVQPAAPPGERAWKVGL